MHKGTDKIEDFYDKHIERLFPRYAIFSFVTCWILNCFVYWFTQFVMGDAYHYDLTNAFDRAVPFMPSWVIIYVLSYVFWGVNYIIIAAKNTKEFWFKFVTADMLSRIICGIIFIVFPTTNVRPEIVGDGFMDWAMGLIYSLDQPYDLFPSLHCLASWMCFLGIRSNKNVSKGYKVFSLVFALLICASTQFTKQHYIVDVIGGIAVAEITFIIGTRTNAYKTVMKFFDKLANLVFKGTTYNEK